MRIFDICGTVVYLLLFHRCFFDGTKETRHGNCGCGGVKKSHYWRQDHGKKEWYEQATAYEAFLVGKTAADIKGVALEDGKPAGDLASSVTITVTGLQDSVLKSIEKAVDLPAAK